ncbi:DUF6343 family protein [Phytoactinopolyspora limicola]|uniref:DUF6343 family protein n=1 Tax=Phytoactinopolyspora limicola TaxID=2715536 RepID=UPI00140984C1|nr:DUF6343 family protein [Phytoactinopolyspora limicola]
MNDEGEDDGDNWLHRPQPSGAEPRQARSMYRTRLGLAAFGLVVAGAAATVFGIQAATDGDAAAIAATILFGVVALTALINGIVVAIRWRSVRASSSDE